MTKVYSTKIIIESSYNLSPSDEPTIGWIFGNKLIKVLPVKKVVVDGKDDKYVSKFETLDKDSFMRYRTVTTDLKSTANKDALVNYINEYGIVKVISYLKSGNLFGYKPTKSTMVNNYYTIDDIMIRDNNVVFSVVNKELNKSLKFSREDLLIELPNIDVFLKGYTKPKSRIVTEGSTVKVINANRGGVNRGDILKVISIDKSTHIINNKDRYGNSNNTIRRSRRTSVTGESSPDIQFFDSGEEPTQSRIDASAFAYTVGSSTIKKKVKPKSTVLYNPNCNVLCADNQGKKVKLKLYQIRVK